MEKSEGSLRRKSMNPVSPLFEKIDASIERYRAWSRKDFIRIYVQLGSGHDSIHERRIRNIEYALYDRGCFSAETCFK